MVVEDTEKLLQKIKSSEKLPGHIAIIMDGNGRWARKKGLFRVAGHKEGIQSVKEIVRSCTEIGINYLTLYTFSTENWRRPKIEVSALMQLLVRTLRKEVDELMDNNVRLNAIGHLSDLPNNVRKKLSEAIERTKSNDGLLLTVALSYSGRSEIIDAVRNIAEEVNTKKITPEEITEDLFCGNLYTAGIPDPDLMIRTSGELRLSNFLLWQLAYTEIYVTDTFWPDFREMDLLKAIENYLNRERRYGNVGQSISKPDDAVS